MARLRGILSSSAPIASGTSAKTLLQLAAPTNQRVAIMGFSITMAGVDPTAAKMLVQLVRQTSAGTMTSRVCHRADNSLPETIQSVGQEVATAEPTVGSPPLILRQYRVSPADGIAVVFDDNEIIMEGGGRIGLKVTSTVDVNCDVTIDFEE